MQSRTVVQRVSCSAEIPVRGVRVADGRHTAQIPVPQSKAPGLVAAQVPSRVPRQQRGCCTLSAVAVAERVVTETALPTVIENLVIVGSGPAGYTAAIYAARANLKPVMFEGFQNGRGGQLMGTTEVENFPGFPDGVTGPELMERMRRQSARWGTELYTEDVDFIDLSQRPFTIRSSDREVKTNSIIIATGATAKRLGIPSEQVFWSKGISACAICDGASPLFKKKNVGVAGGGDSACEEAVYLTKYASHVTLLVRGDKLKASKAMVDRVYANDKITVSLNTGIKDAYGNGVLEGVKTVDRVTGEEKMLDIAGLFYGIGHTPNTTLLGGAVELDDKGYVKVYHGVQTSLEGVYAAGDLHDSEWRQAITAAGSGCMAALSVERYLTEKKLIQEFKRDASMEEEAAQPEQKTESIDESERMEKFDISHDKHKGQYALRKLYHESDRLIAVLFTSPTCGPCRSLKPIFNKVVEEYGKQMHLVEIDIVADSEVAEAAGVTGTPTIQFFKNKSRVEQIPGVKMKKDYRLLIEKHLEAVVV